MPLSPDQRAMLQLLLERDQGYAELATLLGVPEGEVSARARAALGELGGADPDRNVGLTDYVLGQADPIGRADASRHLREHADDRALAATLVERLRELYPAAQLPRLPGEPRSGRLSRRARGGASADERPRGRRPLPTAGLSQAQTRVLVILGSAAVLLVAVVLAMTGAFGGGEDSSSATDTPTTAASAQGNERAVPIPLKATKGSDAAGGLVLGFATADQPFVEFRIRNLDPPANGDAYVLWFLFGMGKGFPLPAQLNVQPDGTLDDRVAVPATILSFIQQSRSIAIALNDAKALDADIRQAVRTGQGALDFPGGTILSADISEATKAARASPGS